MLIYVIGYQPQSTQIPGGYKWFPGSERDKAVETLMECVNSGDSHSVTFVPMSVPKNDNGEIAAWLEEHRNTFEVAQR